MDNILSQIVLVAVLILVIVATWKVYVKAGKPGWGVLVPIYNVYLSLKIVGKPGWWLILYFIPIVNIVIHIIVSIALAKVFGKGTLFGLGLFLLPFIFFPILGFGDAQYTQPA